MSDNRAPGARAGRTVSPLLAGASLVCLAAIAAGCATNSGASGGEGLTFQMRPNVELQQIRRMMDDGEHHKVVPRLVQMLSQYPSSAQSLEARYHLGIAYHELGNYRDAIELLSEYVRLAPDGAHAEPVRDYLALVRADYEREYLTVEDINEQVVALTERLRHEPEDRELKFALADLLWKRGSYKESAELYVDLVRRDPDYMQRTQVRDRVEFLPDDKYVVLTPSELQRREVSRTPLVVFNEHSFRAGRDVYTRESLFFVVTGQVMNRSDSVLYGVQVIVTVYGFGNVVLDTSTVNIGRLNPSEKRAFSVRFMNIEDMINVSRFESTPTFQR